MTSNIHTEFLFEIRTAKNPSGSKFYWVIKSINTGEDIAQSCHYFDFIDPCKEDIANFCARSSTVRTFALQIQHS